MKDHMFGVWVVCAVLFCGVVLACTDCTCSDFLDGQPCSPSNFCNDEVAYCDGDCPLVCPSDGTVSFLPSSIGALTSLTNIDVELSSLQGTLPTSIGSLIALTNLVLNAPTFAQQTIPTQLGLLRNLSSVNFMGPLTGHIPSQIGLLTTLTNLRFAKSKLLEPIPTEIGNLVNLMHLALSNAPVETLPTQIGNLGQLETLDISYTSISSLPSQLGRLTILQEMNLAGLSFESYAPQIIDLLRNQPRDDFGCQLSTALKGSTSYFGPVSYACSGDNTDQIRVQTIWGAHKPTLPKDCAKYFNVTGCKSCKIEISCPIRLVCEPLKDRQGANVSFVGLAFQPSMISVGYAPPNNITGTVSVNSSDPQTLRPLTSNVYYASGNVTFRLEWNIPGVLCANDPYPKISVCRRAIVRVVSDRITEWTCTKQTDGYVSKFFIQQDFCSVQAFGCPVTNRETQTITVTWVEIGPSTNISRACEYCANEIVFVVSFSGDFGVVIPAQLSTDKLNLSSCFSPTLELVDTRTFKITCQPNDGAVVSVVVLPGYATDETPLETPSDSASAFAVSDQTPPSIVVTSPDLSRGDATRFPILFVVDTSEIINGTIVQANLQMKNCINPRIVSVNATRFQVQCDPAGGVEVVLNVTQGVVFDRAGNPNTVGPFSFFNLFSDNTSLSFLAVTIRSNNSRDEQVAVIGDQLIITVECNKPIVTAQVQISGLAASVVRLNSTIWTFSRVVVSFEIQGVAEFIVQAFDLAGNNATTLKSTDGSAVRVITARPVVSITPPNGTLTNHNPEFVLVANSTIAPESWQSAVQLPTSCVNPRRSAINDTAYSVICDAVADQIFHITVSIAAGDLRDEVGNTNAAAISSTTIADCIPPSLVDAAVVTTNLYGNYVTVSDTANATLWSTKTLARATLRFSCNPSVVHPVLVDPGRTTWTWRVSVVPTTTNGLCTFTAEMYDLAGNMRNLTLPNAEVVVDTTNPIVTVSSQGHGNGDSFVGPKTFTFDASEPLRMFDWSSVIPPLCAHHTTRNVSATRFVLECKDESSLIVPQETINVCKDMAGLDNKPIAQFALATPSSNKPSLTSWQIALVCAGAVFALAIALALALAYKRSQQPGFLSLRKLPPTFPHNPKGWTGNAARLSRQLGVWITNWENFDNCMQDLHKILLQKIPEGPGVQSNQTGTDLFISYNWGLHEDNHTNNQDCVRRINEAMKERGWTTWMDDQGDMRGDVDIAMTTGIERSKVALVCLTKKYMDKINSPGMNDNCKFEFTSIMNQKGASEMVVPITMEVFAIENKPSTVPEAEVLITAQPAPVQEQLTAELPTLPSQTDFLD